MATGYCTDPRLDQHDMPEHPENAQRLTAAHRGLIERKLLDQLVLLTPEPASEDLLLSVHTVEYVQRLAQTAHLNGTMFGLDTYVTPRSDFVARLAVGCTLAAVDAVMTGRVENALAGIRPPGHHTTPHEGMGFCLLNNAALAARYAQQRHGVERVLIVDYDVHHGNGTQDIFYDDPSILYVSAHQSPLYPGTGALAETGAGDGVGATVNIPLPPGTGDRGYAAVVEQVVWPVVERFQPELILASVGFDAHWADPLAQMQLSQAGYALLAREVRAMAQAACAGRIVFILEGGYNLTVLRCAWADLAAILLGEPAGEDVLGPAPHGEPSIERVIAQVRARHQLP